METFNPRHVYDSEFRPAKVDAGEYVKVSLHTHSKPNKHIKNTPEQLVNLIDYCAENNVRVLAITDHEKENIDRGNPFETDQRFDQLSDIYDAESNGSVLTFEDFPVTFLKSKEFWGKGSKEEYVHINGIGYEDEIECNHSFKVDYLIKEIKDHNGIAIANHPFSRFAEGLSRKDLKKLIIPEETRPDALEINSMNTAWLDTYYNKKAIKFGREYNIPLVAGSDAHFPFHLEFGHILIDREELDVKNSEVKSVLREKIEAGDYYNYFQSIPINYFLQWWIPTQIENIKHK